MGRLATNDVKMDWLMRAVREIKEEMVCKKEMRSMFKEVVRSGLEEIKQELKKEIKSMIREIVKSELGEIKQELQTMKEEVQGRVGNVGNEPKSYAGAVVGRKRESVMIVKPKKQQESEMTKKLVKENINITDMAVGITKLRKGNNGTVILGCESKSEMEKLKVTVQNKLGKEYNITEPKGAK